MNVFAGWLSDRSNNEVRRRGTRAGLRVVGSHGVSPGAGSTSPAPDGSTFECRWCRLANEHGGGVQYVHPIADMGGTDAATGEPICDECASCGEIGLADGEVGRVGSNEDTDHGRGNRVP